jgi:hypothetical protein
MIKVIRGKENTAGQFEYQVPEFRLFGKSHQPLLDACRAVKRAGGATRRQIGLFREGRTMPDIFTTVGIGARLTIKQEKTGGPPRFVPFKDLDPKTKARAKGGSK